MRKVAIAAGVAALLCVGSVAVAEPAQVDYESMTLEEVKALADEANAYYKEQTTTGSEKAKEAKGLLSSALEEMQGLMNEMGVSEPPTFEEAVETIRKAGLELPPVSAVTNQLADAAVQLVDNGFFFLARGCIFQMWRTMGNDELGSLNRSLG